jgi:hypothetical protein
LRRFSPEYSNLTKYLSLNGRNGSQTEYRFQQLFRRDKPAPDVKTRRRGTSLVRYPKPWVGRLNDKALPRGLSAPISFFEGFPEIEPPMVEVPILAEERALDCNQV